ncbi:MAG: hypothetical protein M0P71_01450 [Melioribacteraceae bacterium]|nr:hypothetical protein [Melioribacteraceae bacterium]
MHKDYEKTIVTATMVPEKSDYFKNAKASIKKIKGAVNLFSPIDVPDLSYRIFVLASEHENKNGDYFSRSQLLASRNSPIYKPFNVEHKLKEVSSYITSPLYNQNQNTIIGHMVHSALAKKDGTILSEDEISKLDTTDDPKRKVEDSLDMVCGAVLYSFYFPNTITDLLQMTEDGKISVSMECWYKGFDFMVGEEIIKSTDSNKEKYLSQWNAGEKVKGRRVSRVLNGLLFGGVGATTNPANEYSCFVTAREKLIARHNELHILQKYNPNELYIKEHEEIERLVASMEVVNEK